MEVTVKFKGFYVHFTAFYVQHKVALYLGLVQYKCGFIDYLILETMSFRRVHSFIHSFIMLTHYLFAGLQVYYMTPVTLVGKFT